MRYECKSVVFGRKPRKEGNEFKTAFFKIFSKNKPLNEEFPEKELDFPNIEKVEVRNENLDYYLEGNDLVIDHISAININQTSNTLKLRIEK
jgi:hypothetical protein